MAEIDLQRKNGGKGWLWGVLGLLALVLIVWWVWPDAESDALMDEGEPTAEVQPLTEPAPESVAEQPGISIAEIIESPATYTGETLTAEVRVTDVPTDRGFWIEDQGERLFVILLDRPQEQPIDIEPGATLRITEAVVRDPTHLEQLAGAPLDADTENIASDQAVFLVVAEQNIQRVGQQTM